MKGTVREILKQASDQIGVLTGNKIVAFIVNERESKKSIQDSIDKLKVFIPKIMGVSWAQMVGGSRKTPVPYARHLFFWRVCDHLRLGVREAGELLNRDHTTAINGRDKIRDYISINDPYTLEKIASLEMYLDFEPVNELYEIQAQPN